MAESTVPITVLVPRSLKRWLVTRAGREDKKVGPYVRKLIERERTSEEDDLARGQVGSS